MNKKQLRSMRIEFKYLINACGCSRASLLITLEEAKKMTEEFTENGKYPQYKINPVTPTCTPAKCFPTLYKLLYPKGGLNKVSHLINRRKNNVAIQRNYSRN